VAAVPRQTPQKPPVKPAPPVDKKPASQSAERKTELQEKLGISHKQVKASKLYSFIDDWYGTPYKYGGCQKAGIDCSCFTNLLYEKVYDKKIARSAADMFLACDQISLEDAVTGDLVFFKIGGNKISHVGVFIKNKWFVHASNSRGVIVNSLDEAYYRKYFFCAGKIRKA
jgi:lipoprotein Spr